MILIKSSADFLLSFLFAERKGFEPSMQFPAYTLSRRAPSTTRTPLFKGAAKIQFQFLSYRIIFERLKLFGLQFLQLNNSWLQPFCLQHALDKMAHYVYL
jgi:hypothetical protein